MLAGEGVIATWNGIAPGARAEIAPGARAEIAPEARAEFHACALEFARGTTAWS